MGYRLMLDPACFLYPRRLNFDTTIKLTNFYKIDIALFIEITKSLNFESLAGGDEHRRSRSGGSLHGHLETATKL